MRDGQHRACFNDRPEKEERIKKLCFTADDEKKLEKELIKLSKKVREKHRLSQKDLALVLDVHPRTVENLERTGCCHAIVVLKLEELNKMEK